MGTTRHPDGPERVASSSAELVYGAPLTVPGEFFPSSTGAQEPNKLLTALLATVKNFMPIPTSRHGLPHPSVPSELGDSQFIFIDRDAHRLPLQRPCEGPFKVLGAGPKSFTIDRGGRPELITIDRLKSAHLDMDQPVQIARPRPRGHPPGQQRAVAPAGPQPSPPPQPAPPDGRQTTNNRSRRAVRHPDSLHIQF